MLKSIFGGEGILVPCRYAPYIYSHQCYAMPSVRLGLFTALFIRDHQVSVLGAVVHPSWQKIPVDCSRVR